MAVIANPSTLNPWRIAVGVPITDEDQQEAEELLNHAAGEGIATTHASCVTGASGWGTSGNEVVAHGVTFPTGGGFTPRYEFRIWVDDDAQEIDARTVCDMPVGNTGDVRVTIGAAAAVVNSHAAAVTSTQDSTVATSSSGTGELAVTVEIDHTLGSAADCELRRMRVRNATIAAANLPAPVDE